MLPAHILHGFKNETPFRALFFGGFFPNQPFARCFSKAFFQNIVSRVVFPRFFRKVPLRALFLGDF